MKLTNDAKVYMHYLFTLNYKLALHVLAFVPDIEEQVDVNLVMEIGSRLLARSQSGEYANFISVDGDSQLRWARKHASHKHNIELTIARAIRLTLEHNSLSQAPILMCAGAHRFIEGTVVKGQVAERIDEAARNARSFQMIVNTSKHLHVVRIRTTEGEAEPLPTTSPVKKVY